MRNDGSSGYEGEVDSLLIALATQAGEMSAGRFSRLALESLVVDEHRPVVRHLLGTLGHLIHYGVAVDIPRLGEHLTALFDQLIDTLRRTGDPGTTGLLPGDLVEIVVARPGDHFDVGQVMKVYLVGDDGTLDIGFESLVDDYVIHTVKLEDIRRPTSR